MLKISLSMALGIGSVFGLTNLVLWNHVVANLAAVLP